MAKDITSATEYKIGNTTYIVNVKFAPNCKENISDVVRRLKIPKRIGQSLKTRTRQLFQRKILT